MMNKYRYDIGKSYRKLVDYSTGKEEYIAAANKSGCIHTHTVMYV